LPKDEAMPKPAQRRKKTHTHKMLIQISTEAKASHTTRDTTDNTSKRN